MDTVKYEKVDGGLARIAMARPQFMNAINGTMRRELQDAMDEAGADPTVRVVILTGEGTHFSSGGDIPFLQSMDRAQIHDYHRTTLDLVRAIALCSKPTVASVRGACAGGSFGFALCCDYLIASQTAYFSAQFLRIGLVPDMGVGYMLAQRLGVHKARKLLLDNQVVRADKARAMGLCDELHPDDSLDGETERLALDLALLPPFAVGQTKALMRQAEGSFERFLDAEMTAAARCLGGDEFIEGTRAFFEKRAPRFQ